MIRHKRKIRNYRGSRTCGGGSAKNRKGAGNKGGRGKSGYLKHFWTYTVKYEPERIAPRGFRPPGSYNPYKINVGQIQDTIDMLKNTEAYDKTKKELDLAKLGIEKVLGMGVFSEKISIKASSFSKNAIEKIESSGGKAIVG